jgi:hypothetical protein
LAGVKTLQRKAVLRFWCNNFIDAAHELMRWSIETDYIKPMRDSMPPNQHALTFTDPMNEFNPCDRTRRIEESFETQPGGSNNEQNH